MSYRTMAQRFKGLLREVKYKIGKDTSDKPYNYLRKDAKEYAHIYALSANTQKYPLYKENDCTNFVSQALVAGGMKMKGNDYRKSSEWFCYTTDPSNLNKSSLTWRSAQYFRMYWKERAGESKKMLLSEAVKNYGLIYNTLEVGDVIQYGNANDIAYHTQIVINKEVNIVTGKEDLFIAQHSANRKNVSLNEYLLLLSGKKCKYIYIYQF